MFFQNFVYIFTVFQCFVDVFLHTQVEKMTLILDKLFVDGHVV